MDHVLRQSHDQRIRPEIEGKHFLPLFAFDHFDGWFWTILDEIWIFPTTADAVIYSSGYLSLGRSLCMAAGGSELWLLLGLVGGQDHASAAAAW